MLMELLPLCVAILVATPFLLVDAINDQPPPLQWKFQVLPTTCAQISVCVQSSLGNGRALMFDGKARRTWDFGVTKETNGTWTHVATHIAPPGRQDYAMASTDGGDKVILFGGANIDYTMVYNDTWMFNQRTNDWLLLAITSSPLARNDHAMASLEKSNKVLLFGGADYNGNYLDDTWTFDSSKNKWNKVDTKASPSPRYLHAMTSLGMHDNVLLFGGLDMQGNYLDDTWQFQQSTRTWMKDINSPTPPARTRHSMATLGVEGNVLLFGGLDNGDLLRDTWLYDQNSSHWTKINDGSTASPSYRMLPAMASLGVDGKIVLFGGNNELVNYVDTWTFDQKQREWIDINAQATIFSPEGRQIHSMASLGDSKILLFGGGNVQHKLSVGTWIFDLTLGAWTKVDTLSSPRPRVRSAMALLEKKSGSVLMFGGFPLDPCKDTWIFNQSTSDWSHIPVTISPNKRSGHTIVSLGKKDMVLLFGGSDGFNFFGDTWIFKKREWIQINCTSAPPARWGHAMAALGDSNMVVLFGGATSNLRFDDTWIFDLSTTNWKINTSPQPPQRSFFAMASMGETAVIYGGTGNTGIYLDDTWLFHRETSNNWKWTQLSTQIAGRTNFAMATTISGVVLFGGLAQYQMGTLLSPTVANDTWFISKGCPIGHAGDDCAPCLVGTWKNNSDPSPTCVSCPSNTTTGADASTSIENCVLCDTNSSNGVCFVDIETNYTADWRCIGGAYGKTCQKPCPGGFNSPCYGNGNCDTGVLGKGHCTCDFAYTLSSDCSFPWTLLLLVCVFGLLGALVYIGWKWWRKKQSMKILQMELYQSLMEEEHNEEERKRREPLNDGERIKLLKHLDTLERSLDLEAAQSVGGEAGKFVGTRELITGVVQEAAGGLQSFLCVDANHMRRIKTDGEAAIIQECKDSEDEEVVDLLNYIIHQTCSEKKYPNGIRDKGRSPTMNFEDFFANRRVGIAGLERAHVIALRLCKFFMLVVLL